MRIKGIIVNPTGFAARDGGLKKVVDPGWGELSLGQVNHTLQVSFTFSMDSDQELKGIIRIKDKIDEILVD